MGLFGSSKKDEIINSQRKELARKDKRIKQLESLCEEKDSYFSELMSDGLRHGSPLAAKHMAQKKEYLRNR